MRRDLGVLVAVHFLAAAENGLAAAENAGTAPPPAVRALLATGAWESGAPRIVDGRLLIAAASVPVDQLVQLRFPGGDPAATIDQGVIFRNGDVLVGTITSLQSDKLVFVSDLLGAKTAPASAVEAVVLAPCALAALGGPGADFAGVELSNGDRVLGAITWINELTVDERRQAHRPGAARTRRPGAAAVAGDSGDSGDSGRRLSSAGATG